MQRYFCNEKVNDVFCLSKEDSYHITKVMRLKLTDRIEIVNESKSYISEIIDINEIVKARVVEVKEETKELECPITLVQALVNEQKMDYILQKNTELGITEIIPMSTIRSVVKVDKKEDKKITRWQKIVKEASEQSKRTKIPVVTNIMSVEEISKLENYDYKFICSVNEMSTSIKTVLSNIRESDRIIFVIGPEGGFDPKEEKMLMDNGFISISLGARVLRTETASLFVMSCINYFLMR